MLTCAAASGASCCSPRCQRVPGVRALSLGQRAAQESPARPSPWPQTSNFPCRQQGRGWNRARLTTSVLVDRLCPGILAFVGCLEVPGSALLDADGIRASRELVSGLASGQSLRSGRRIVVHRSPSPTSAAGQGMAEPVTCTPAATFCSAILLLQAGPGWQSCPGQE